MKIGVFKIKLVMNAHALLITCFCLCMAAGCTSEGNLDYYKKDINYNHTEWKVKEQSLALKRNLVAGDDERYFFGKIKDVAVRPDGRMYVVDGQAPTIRVLAPNGTLQESIGSMGGGPGEFRYPSKVYFVRGDSLYVTHGGLATRLSAFGPSHEFAYEISFSSSVAPHRSTPDRAIPILGESEFFGVWFPSPWPGQDSSDSEASVRGLSHDGREGDTLFTFPGSQQLARKVGTGYKFYNTPWDRGPYLALGPEGNLHYAGNDSLTVRTYDAEGTLRRVVEIPFKPVPITNADLEREFSNWSSAEDVEYVRDKIPSTKPAFKHFLVDDEGRYWFGRSTANPDSMAWLVAWPKEKRIVTVTLPAEVEILTVQDGYAYGKTATEAGDPVVIRYRIVLKSSV